MTGPVRRLHVDQVAPGMMLAEDVCASGGGLLLPAGTTLTQAQIDRLIQRDVSELAIVAPDQGSDEGAVDLEARRTTERQRVMHLFRRAAGDPLTQALLRTVLDYRQERIK